MNAIACKPAEEPGLCFDARIVGPLVFGKIGKPWSAEGKHAIGMLRGTELMAGVVYEDFTSHACSAHIAVPNPTPWLRTFLRAAFWYPFVYLDLTMMLGFVPGNNAAALRLDKWMGFEETARIPGVYGADDLVILSMQRDRCRWLNLGGSDGRQG